MFPARIALAVGLVLSCSGAINSAPHSMQKVSHKVLTGETAARLQLSSLFAGKVKAAAVDVQVEPTTDARPDILAFSIEKSTEIFQYLGDEVDITLVTEYLSRELFAEFHPFTFPSDSNIAGWIASASDSPDESYFPFGIPTNAYPGTLFNARVNGYAVQAYAIVWY